MEKETRRLDINWRVFSKFDIRRLAQILESAFQVAKKAKHHSSLSFHLYCQGGISYESDSVSILEDEGPLDIKRTISIQMTFYDYEEERRIDVSLREGNHNSDLSVRGTDKNWVQGNFTSLLETIESVQPQDTFFLRHKGIIYHVISLGVGSLIYLILEFLITRFIEPIKNPSEFVMGIRNFLATNLWAYFLIQIFDRWLMGLGFAYFIRESLIKLWPEIEFDFGPDHMNKQKIRKQRIKSVVSLVIIPLLIDFFLRIY